jgi:murein L,D-transpeptidase YafK
MRWRVAVVLIPVALCRCGGGDPCQQAAAHLTACGTPLPPAFLAQCPAHPEFAEAILAEGCPPALLPGKADEQGSALQVPKVKAKLLVLDAEEKTLVLYRQDEDEDGELARYRVGLGAGEYISDEGKRKQGDWRTPRGKYRLLAGRASKYLRFLHIAYPNSEDAARGLDAGLITRAQHDAIVAATRAGQLPPQETALGGYVGIHGFGEKFDFVPKRYQHLHHYVNVTRGCVLVTDAEILVLDKSYIPGATLEIR